MAPRLPQLIVVFTRLLLLTRSSANAEEPREHSVSWNRVKCCTNVRRITFKKACNRRMTFKVIQGHCRCCHLIGHSLYTISYISLPLYVYLCLAPFSRYFAKKLRYHVTFTMPTWAQFVIIRPTSRANACKKYLRFYLQPSQRNLRGCKILKWITWPGPRPFRGWSVLGRLKANTWYSVQAHKIWRRLSIYFMGCEILECVTRPWPRPLRGHMQLVMLVPLVAKPCTKFVVALTVAKIFHGVYNSKVGHVTLISPLTVCHRQAGTYCDKPLHQIWNT